jgi:hypothetical protein
MAISEATTHETASRWTGFVAAAVAAAVISLVAAFALIKGTELAGRQKLAHQVLIDYQKQKLSKPVGEVIFLGDSSLGTAVNASLWQSLTGKSASNLALHGSYGYAGTLDMLQAILARHHPTDIVIVQTAAMMKRTPKEFVPLMLTDETGLLQRFRNLWLETMNVNEFAASVDFLLKHLRSKQPDIDDSYIEHDYVRQIDKPAVPPEPGVYDPQLVNEANLLELNKIAAICRERSLTCVYLHGPLASPYCEQEKAYFDRVNALIRSSGLVLAQDHPPCLSPQELGNTYDHTKPAFKDDMTRRIAVILRPYLSK